MFKYVYLKQTGAVRGQNISRVISAQESGINIYCNRIKERSPSAFQDFHKHNILPSCLL